MEDKFNPYAPPKTSMALPLEERAGDCWRHGGNLYVRVGRPLPCRCVLCNEPAEAPVTARKVYWHRLGLCSMATFNSLLAALAAMGVCQEATIYPGLCARHERRRQGIILAAWIGLAVAVALGAWGWWAKNSMISAAGVVMGISSYIFGTMGSSLLAPVGIDKEWVVLAGASPRFLDSLPPAMGIVSKSREKNDERKGTCGRAFGGAGRSLQLM
jgi:hypothetical protein